MRDSRVESIDVYELEDWIEVYNYIINSMIILI